MCFYPHWMALLSKMYDRCMLKRLYCVAYLVNKAILNVKHIINKLQNVGFDVHTYVICVIIIMILKRNMMYVILSIRCWLLTVCYLSRLITNTNSNLTIPAWNVKGIHPAIRYLIWLMQDADATCISELRLCENNLYVLNQISDELTVVSAANKLSIRMTLFGRVTYPVLPLFLTWSMINYAESGTRMIFNIITLYLPVLIQVPTSTFTVLTMDLRDHVGKIVHLQKLAPLNCSDQGNQCFPLIIWNLFIGLTLMGTYSRRIAFLYNPANKLIIGFPALFRSSDAILSWLPVGAFLLFNFWIASLWSFLEKSASAEGSLSESLIPSFTWL